MIGIWKFCRIITKYPELSRESIAVDPILSSLVSQIVEIVDEYKLKIENEELVFVSFYIYNYPLKLYNPDELCMRVTIPFV